MLKGVFYTSKRVNRVNCQGTMDARHQLNSLWIHRPVHWHDMSYYFCSKLPDFNPFLLKYIHVHTQLLKFPGSRTAKCRQWIAVISWVISLSNHTLLLSSMCYYFNFPDSRYLCCSFHHSKISYLASEMSWSWIITDESEVLAILGIFPLYSIGLIFN